jgi:cytochrome c peroxidase
VANCSKCHSGPLFTDYSFHNNGTSILNGDYGRGQLTLDSSDFYTFKVPSLRNAALTAPFMHDGSVATLADVLLQYNAGGTLHDYQSLLIQPLGLSKSQLLELQSFIEAL